MCNLKTTVLASELERKQNPHLESTITTPLFQIYVQITMQRTLDARRTHTRHHTPTTTDTQKQMLHCTRAHTHTHTHRHDILTCSYVKRIPQLLTVDDSDVQCIIVLQSTHELDLSDMQHVSSHECLILLTGNRHIHTPASRGC